MMALKYLDEIKSEEPKLQAKEYYKREQNPISDFLSNHYKAASSAAKSFDTTPLERIVDDYKSSESLPRDFASELTSQVYKLAEYIGLTKKAIISDSKKQLQKQNKHIETYIGELNEQISYVGERIGFLDKCIGDATKDIDGLWKYCVTQNEEISKLQSHIKTHTETVDDSTHYSQDPHMSGEMFSNIDNLEVAKQNLEQYDRCLGTQKEMRDDLLSIKLAENLSLSIMHSDILVLQSLQNKLEYYTKVHDHKPVLSSLSKAKITIGKTYNFEQKMIETDHKERTKYNNALDQVPTFQEVQKELTKKRRSFSRLKW